MATAKSKKTIAIQWSLTRVVIYRRVSTKEQGDSGLGLESQASQCRKVCETLGLEVIGDYSEVASGKTDPRERVELTAAIAQCQLEGARLMVAKLDRFSREVYHVTGYCDKYFYGDRTPDLITADSPKASMLEIRIKAVVAQEEREAISKRTKAALLARKERGASPNGAVGRERAAEAKRKATEGAIARALELRKLGRGYGSIANVLNEEGLLTSGGGQWFASGIRARLMARG